MVPWLATCASVPPDTRAVTPARQLGAGLLMATLTVQLLGSARELRDSSRSQSQSLAQEGRPGLNVFQNSTELVAVTEHDGSLGCSTPMYALLLMPKSFYRAAQSIVPGSLSQRCLL